MVADPTAVAYFAPIWAFLAVFFILYALLAKLEMFGKDQKWINIFISFVVAAIFVSAASVTQYVLTIIPWLAVLVISLFFLLLLLAFVGSDAKWLHKGVGVGVVVVAIVIFIVSGVKVFNYVLAPYLPGSPYYGEGDPSLLLFTDWLYSPAVVGAIVLILLSALATWQLTKK